MQNHNFNDVDDLRKVIKDLLKLHSYQMQKDNDLYHEYKYKLSDPDLSIDYILQSKDLLSVALQESRVQKMIETTEKLINLYEDYVDEFFDSIKKY